MDEPQDLKTGGRLELEYSASQLQGKIINMQYRS